MISSRQIKAARALLGWTQSDLAKATGFHLNAINKIENNTGEPRSSTLERIQSVCEGAGIRFRGQRGVELKDDVFDTKRFEGPEFIRHHIDDILAVARSPEDEVLNCGIDEEIFNVNYSKQNERYYKHIKKTGFRERYLMSRPNPLFTNPDRNVHRRLPEKILGTIAYVVYGDRVAFLNWQTQETLIIRSKSLSTTFRGQFEFLWSQAKPLERI